MPMRFICDGRPLVDQISLFDQGMPTTTICKTRTKRAARSVFREFQATQSNTVSSR
jgi:hypothetical protein